MICEKCRGEITGTGHQHAGRMLCEDCYIDVMAAPRTCDPWAVYSAKNTSAQGVQLTELQQKMLELVKAGPLSEEQLCARLGLHAEQFRAEFAALRHMELMRACKIENQIRYTLMEP